MKKTILVVLMVLMITTPCFAQEIEPNGIFSIDGTEWEATYIFPPRYHGNNHHIRFYKEYVLLYGSTITMNAFYVDLGIISFFIADWFGEDRSGHDTREIYFGIMQPIGIGVMTVIGKRLNGPYLIFRMATLHKINDNWTPPGIDE